MINTGSALISEIIGPAGSINDGAFSCAYIGPEGARWLDELLLELWPPAKGAAAAMDTKADQRKTCRENRRNDMKKKALLPVY